ncbi:MAG: surface-adhesin E family protein [Smithella sp.]
MRINNIYSIICLVIILLLANQAWAADWKFFASSGSGDMYYDKNSIVKVNKNIVRVWTKKTYSEKGKLEEYSFLKSLGKAPGNPYILSHELKLLEIECLNKKIKISSDRICDKRGHVAVTTTQSYSKLNDIVRKSSDEELQNIVCSVGKTPEAKQKKSP